MGVFDDLKRFLGLHQQAAALPVSRAMPAAFLPTSGDSERPRIAVSGSSSSSKSVAAAMSQLRSAGADPIFIGDQQELIQKHGAEQSAASVLKNVDGVMILGNDGDIDPAKYGAVKDPHTKLDTNLTRAAFEEALIRQSSDGGVPLLGVCGGEQLLNVIGGGTLHQHVPDLVGDNHHSQGDSNIAPFVPVQAVSIIKGSRLGEIGGTTHSIYTPTHQELPPGVVMENSFHHQAVKDVRPDFMVNAISSDGIIEGIEPKPDSKYANQFLLGVQWHPEFGASELGPKIANSFTQAARDYALSKQQAVDFSAADKNLPVLPGGAVENLIKSRQNQTLQLG